MIRSTLSLWRGELGELLAPAAGDEAHAAVRQPRRDGGLGGDLREHGVGVRRRRGAAQDDRVARLQAQRGRVDRDVRAAPRRRPRRRRAARAPCARPGRWAGAGRRSARRPGRAARRSGAPRARSRPRARRRGAGGRAARRRCSLSRAELHVALVGLEDLLDARLERRRDRLQRGVLDGGVDLRERARRALGRAARLGDGCDCVAIALQGTTRVWARAPGGRCRGRTADAGMASCLPTAV